MARAHVTAGHHWCVELDLEKFFDRVNHDILMACIERRIKDKCVLRLIRRYLEAGIMSGGVVSPRQEGTPQGGPLSPLLSNILLDELDRELERRGHRFVRYADDANIYVRSPRAGERVLVSVERFLRERLKLTVNRKKSQVARAWKCDYLGYGMSWHQQPRLRVARMSLDRLRDRLRMLLRSVRARKMATVIERINPVLRGWASYFKLSQSKRPLEELDGWVRHKLRCVIWRQWKQPPTRLRNLMRLGLSEERANKSAFNGRGPWWNSGAQHMNYALPKQLWDRLGLVSILDTINRLTQYSLSAPMWSWRAQGNTWRLGNILRSSILDGAPWSDEPLNDVLPGGLKSLPRIHGCATCRTLFIEKHSAHPEVPTQCLCGESSTSGDEETPALNS